MTTTLLLTLILLLLLLLVLTPHLQHCGSAWRNFCRRCSKQLKTLA